MFNDYDDEIKQQKKAVLKEMWKFTGTACSTDKYELLLRKHKNLLTIPFGYIGNLEQHAQCILRRNCKFCHEKCIQYSEFILLPVIHK